MAGHRTLLETAGNMGGYLENCSLKGHDMHLPPYERSANYTLRIYSERLAEFLTVVEDNYNLWGMEQTSEDMTASYAYSGAHNEDLYEQEARLLKDLENTRLETSEKLDLERRLAEVQSAIRNNDRQQYNIDDGVLYSTVSIELYEVIFIEEEPVVEEPEPEPEPDPTFNERVNHAVTTSANGFVAFCQGVLIVLIRLAPALIILAVLAVITLVIYRIVRRRQNKRRMPPIIDNQEAPNGNNNDNP
jgi:hypothetical protein